MEGEKHGEMHPREMFSQTRPEYQVVAVLAGQVGDPPFTLKMVLTFMLTPCWPPESSQRFPMLSLNMILGFMTEQTEQTDKIMVCSDGVFADQL